jgi:hypothetical protein
MVVRDPGQEEKIRQTPRLEGGEARGVERERNGAKRRRRGPRPTGGSVVCRWRVQTRGFSIGTSSLWSSSIEKRSGLHKFDTPGWTAGAGGVVGEVVAVIVKVLGGG